jgi:hypothetical protein
VISVVLREQLGNQLFQWATGLSLALRQQTKLRLFTSNYGRRGTGLLLRHFPISARFVSPLFGIACKRLFNRELFHICPYRVSFGDNSVPFTSEETRNNHFHRFQALPNGTLLDGLFQSWVYFHNTRVAIVSELALTSQVMLNHCSPLLLDRVLSSNSVAVHVRRGDYLAPVNRGRFDVCRLSYFLRAMDIMRNRVANALFFIFSNDIPWVSENLCGPDCVVVDHFARKIPAISDFVLMSHCRHHIISNSSFSWWASYASGSSGITLMPNRWLNDGSAQIADKQVPGWELVSVAS